MSEKHSTTNTRNFKHLTPYQRGEIQALLREGLPKTKIAQTIGISRSTLYAELARGTVTQMNSYLTKRREYFADTGQLVYQAHRTACRKPYKVDVASDFLRHIERAILEDKLSPDAVCGRAKLIGEFAEEFGHWEIDTVVGQRTIGEVLLTLDERRLVVATS